MQLSLIQPTLLPLTSLQQDVETKISRTVGEIVKKIITTIIVSHQLSSQVFVRVHIMTKRTALSNLDDRTQKFFQKIYEATCPELDKAPSLPQFFVILAREVGDPAIQEKFVKSVALNLITSLSAELDAMKPTIVNDIVNSH